MTGTVDANGLTTNSYFEYGEDEALDLKTPQDSVGTGLDAAKVVTDILGLQPATSYSYRIVAENAAGTSTGATHTLTTPTASSSGTPSKGRARKAGCRVPRVRGKTVKAAKRAIRRSRCKVGKIKRNRSKSVRRGRVVSQSPKAGTRRPKGAKVKMTVRR